MNHPVDVLQSQRSPGAQSPVVIERQAQKRPMPWQVVMGGMTGPVLHCAVGVGEGTQAWKVNPLYTPMKAPHAQPEAHVLSGAQPSRQLEQFWSRAQVAKSNSLVKGRAD